MNFDQTWPQPSRRTPIVIIGAGGIVVDSHLPAYTKAGYEVRGIWNRSRDRAVAVAERFGINEIYEDLAEVAAQQGVIFDLAASMHVHAEVLEKLPDEAPVLIQKPLGIDLSAATHLLEICRRKRLKAAVNFQLRFSPMMLAVRHALEAEYFGTLTEVEVHLNLLTPWHQFPTLVQDPRVEIVSHSVHYMDLIQSLVGAPIGVLARSFSYPGSVLNDTRTTAILDYGKDLRCALSINHHHDFGRSHQDATIRFEGTHGAALCKLGVLLDYPTGEPDELWMGERGGALRQIPLEGYWFPDAFANVMHNMQRYVAGEDDRLQTSVESAWTTMAIVEACYSASSLPTQSIPDLPGA